MPACWRQSNGIVVRLRGSEYLLTENEFDEFAGLVNRVWYGDREAVSDGYAELVEGIAARAKGIDLVAALGLKPAFKRRF